MCFIGEGLDQVKEGRRVKVVFACKSLSLVSQSGIVELHKIWDLAGGWTFSLDGYSYFAL